MRLLQRMRRSSAPTGPYAQRQARDDAAIAGILDAELREDSVCVDIGAHRGDFLDRFLARAPQGAHVAIEALPDLAEDLRARYGTVRVVHCALADSEGEATFHRQLDAAAWSSLSPDHKPASGSRTEALTVPLRTLDSLVDRADFVKIDVEGAELGVLRGATKLLGAVGPPVLFEHAHIHAKHFGTRAGDVWDVLAGHDYTIHSLLRPPALEREEFEALCARAEELEYGLEAETNWIARTA